MTTKESILYTALGLFSERGYEGVSMRDLAREVGIKASSIYNHFSSKEDIFNSLLLEMERRYEEAVREIRVPEGDLQDVALQYAGLPLIQLQTMAVNLFLYFAKDEFAAPFRKMVSIEKYRDSSAGQVFKSIFIDGALEYQAGLFHALVEQGEFIDQDPKTIALHFYSPIFLLLESYDEAQENQLIERLKKHVSQFAKLYVRGE